jgi:integrase/recombinase XerC
MLITQFLNYLQKERRYSEHTIKAYQSDLNQLSNYLEEDFEEDDLKKITPQMLRSWMVSMMEVGVSPKTVNRKISSVKSFYQYLRRKELIKAIPTSQITAPKFKKPLPKYMKNREMDLLKEMVFEYDLCPRLAGLQPISSGKCNYVEEIECRGACQEKESASDYNKRVKESIKEKLINNQTFLIKDLNEETQQQSIVYVEKGRYKGYGVLPAETKVEQADDVKPHLETAYDDQDMSNLIHAYLQKNPDKVTYL